MAKLSAAELAKREEIIQSMKKNKRSLVKRYITDKKAKGEEPVNPEAVMYGRATNIAKKVAETQMEKSNLKELVRAALMQEKKFPDLTGDGKVTYADVLKGRGVDIKEGPEDRDWATYVKSLVNDIRINGLGDYTTFSEDDFIADYEEYIGGKMDLDEDLDLGHQDNEPHMLKGDLYRIGKYAMELYQMVDQFEGMGEVDFPHWWQSKIIKAKEMMSSAKHYLDFETKEPEIDAMVGAMTGEEPHMGEPNSSLNEEAKKIVSAKQNGDKSYTVKYSDDTTEKIYVSNDAWDEINDKYGKLTEAEAVEKKVSKEVEELEEIRMFHDPIGYKKPEPDPRDKIYTKEYKGQGVYDIFKNGEKIKTITGGEGEANAYINKLKRELEEGSPKSLAERIAKRIKEDVVKGSNVKKVGDDYRVLSGKTGKMWPQKYKTKKDAEDAIQAYHANKAKK